MEKRGQELSIGTLILIVLGIIVLVLLILGFSIGWESLFSKIGIASGSDLSAMVAACKVAAASQSSASYCEFKKVKLSDGTKMINCEYKDVEEALGEDKLSRACGSIYGTGEKGVEPICTKYKEGDKNGEVISGNCLGGKKDVSNKVASLERGKYCCL